MSGYNLKTLYTQNERDSIVNYIIAHGAYSSLKGNTFWKEMEEAKICTRTWQSMKSHFKTTIAPNLKFYKIPQVEKDKILAAYYTKLENKETKIPVETGEVSSTTNVQEKRKQTQISINEYLVPKKRIVKEFSNANIKKFRTTEHNKCLGFDPSDIEKSKSIVSKIHETVEYLRSEI